MDSALVDRTSIEYLDQWKRLVSTTNWEKGKIICDWRDALEASGAPALEYSDEAWSRRVGNVTPQHVGRLRDRRDAPPRLRAAGQSQQQRQVGEYFVQVRLRQPDVPVFAERVAEVGRDEPRRGLIQAALGMAFGFGNPCVNRSGLSAYASASTRARCSRFASASP